MAAPVVARDLAERLAGFLAPLVEQLDRRLDRRLVRTFLATVRLFLEIRHRACGLLLSELGGYLASPAHAPAGTKRLSNLLRSPRWSHRVIERFLWRQAVARLAELEAAGRDAVAVWDESVVEKPESTALEGLCPVRSAKAARLKRIKPGFYNPPGGPPVFVPGLHWLAVMVMGWGGPPTLAVMRWWTTRGRFARERRHVEGSVLRECARAWGRRVLHVFDRGFAGAPWLERTLAAEVRFVMRWPKHYLLLGADGQERKAWELLRGKRSETYRQLWDAHRRRHYTAGVAIQPVRHPAHPDHRLWLIVSRPGTGRPPWYLVTNEPLASPDDAWPVVLAYARRWQIEMAWRFTKTELAMESPRLWFWENRLKLLLMVTLAYAFLLALLKPACEGLRAWLLRHWCHRTGKRSRQTATPLYRLRSALSRLWLSYRPKLSLPTETSG